MPQTLADVIERAQQLFDERFSEVLEPQIEAEVREQIRGFQERGDNYLELMSVAHQLHQNFISASEGISSEDATWSKLGLDAIQMGRYFEDVYCLLARDFIQEKLGSKVVRVNSYAVLSDDNRLLVIDPVGGMFVEVNGTVEDGKPVPINQSPWARKSLFVFYTRDLTHRKATEAKQVYFLEDGSVEKYGAPNEARVSPHIFASTVNKGVVYKIVTDL